jgi:hypothetical protein
MAKFQPGICPNPLGRGSSKNKIPSKTAIEKSILKGSDDAIKTLRTMLKHSDEKVREKAGTKIVKEGMKLLREQEAKGRKYRTDGVQGKFLAELEGAIIELQVLMTDSIDPLIRVRVASYQLDEILAVLRERDERKEKKGAKVTTSTPTVAPLSLVMGGSSK